MKEDEYDMVVWQGSTIFSSSNFAIVISAAVVFVPEEHFIIIENK